jgi:VanZ family protein
MFWRTLWPAYCWAAIILILCGLPGEDIPELTFLQWLRPDKIVHLILFGTFCFLLLKGIHFQKNFRTINNGAVTYALLISIGYGALIEILQATIFIHRSGDVRDALANAIGAVIGYWIFRKNFLKTNKLHHDSEA